MFGIHLLEDDNGAKVQLIERDHRHDGTEAILVGILRKWLDTGGPTCNYAHLIEPCVRRVRLVLGILENSLSLKPSRQCLKCIQLV